eukprot:103365_1
MSSQDNEEKKNNNDNDQGGCACCSCCDTCALKLNNYIEKAFCAVGWYIGAWPYMVIGLVLLFLSLCCFGYIFLENETDLFNLWTPTDSPVFDEKEFIDFYWGDKDYGLIIITGYAKEGEHTDILSDEYLQQWYQIHIDLATKLPTKEYPYTALDNSQQTATFGYFPENYNDPPGLATISAMAELGLGPSSYHSEIIPICRPISESPAQAQFTMPCYMVTLLDCFSEGGYFFPWENYLENTQLKSFIPANFFTFARSSFMGMKKLQIGETLAPSCAGLSGNTWPPNLIYGGEVRMNASNQTSTILSLKSYQIGAFTDSPLSIATKVKIAAGKCKYTPTYGLTCPEITDEEKKFAEEWIDEWLLDFIDFMKDYAEELKNDDGKLFNLVFWTPRTTVDLLREASSADFGLLAIAYIAMIIFASLTAINFNDWFLSRSEASCAGVLLVLFAVLATIGLGSFLQVPLSPNIVQVLPFIALGFGVDDMFVLLFSFKYRERATVQEMISETVRIAGSSVALTSLANFFGFLIGTTMVLPDVARFATYGAIIVLLNFIALIFGFTGVLTLVARRMKNEYNDWSWVFCWATFTRAKKITSEKPAAQEISMFDPLFDWLTKLYTRIVMLIAFVVLIIIGIYGCTLIQPGLPLPDIVPDNSYAYDFLRIREMFYFTYPMSLYTDAEGAKHKAIDWENKFEDWVNATKDIYSISDTIWTDPAVHSFWAWSLQSYLQGRHLTTSYELAEPFDIAAALADDPVYQTFMCQSDADIYCSSLVRNYLDLTGDLFNCLLVNYQLNNLDSDCSEWVYNTYAATVDTGIAKQLYITSFDDDSVDGLYVRPSTNDIKVFIRQPNKDGFIYQVPATGEWRILNKDFETLYIGESTSIDSDGPSQGSWRDGADGKTPVAITHIYYDFIVSYLGLLRDTESIFMESDYTPDHTFLFSNLYNSNSDGEATCQQYEVMRLLMSNTDAYNQIEFSSDIDDGAYDTICNAVLEASEMCVGIRDGLDIGSVYCGSAETGAHKNLWYVSGETTDGKYQIMSSPNNNNGEADLFTSFDTFSNCEDPSKWVENVNFTYNYLKPCGTFDTDFGGFGISQTNNDTCNIEAQKINLQCDGFGACTDLKACYNDYRFIAESVTDTDCDFIIDAYDQALRQGRSAFLLSQKVAKCSFKYYGMLSDCCKSAVQTSIIALPQYTCGVIESFFDPIIDFSDNLKTVCQLTNQCKYIADDTTGGECVEQSNGNVFDDCRALIIGSAEFGFGCSLADVNMTRSQVRKGQQEKFFDCMQSTVTESFPNTRDTIRVSGSDDCQSTFTAKATLYADCLYPIDSFYNLLTQKYDYSICSDADIESIETNSGNLTCDTTNTASDTQLECLEDYVDYISPGCCKLAIEQIMNDEHTYSFTNECEMDVNTFCQGASAGSVLLGAMNDNALATACLQGILGASGILTQSASQLSEKCFQSIINCEANGIWPVTPMTTTESLPCGIGYTGNQTRTCMAPPPIATWGDVNRTACVPLTCPEVNAADNLYNQYWPETNVGAIYKIQGGAINSFGNQDTKTQVSQELQGIFVTGGNTPCNPLEDNNVWYVRRACMLNPYDETEAIWQDPIIECKPFVTMWNNIQTNTVCDFITEQVTAGLAAKVDATGFVNTLESTKKANLIVAIPWLTQDIIVPGPTEIDDQISLSQTICSLQLDNCVAFTFDNDFQISYFFDYCPTLTSTDLAGQIPEVVDSPAYVTYPITTQTPYGGPLDTLAFGLSAQMWGTGDLPLNVTLSKNIFTVWSFYPDPIVDEFAPHLSSFFDLSMFAARHTTYISPLKQEEFIASYCSLRTAAQIAAGVETAFIAPINAWNADGIPESECFNNTLWLFFIDPTGSGVIKRDSVVFVDDSQVANLTGFDNVQIVATSNGIIISDINDDRVAVEFITDLRDRLDIWADDEMYVIPGGLIINLFSQYIDVEKHMINNLIYVSIAIFLCGLIFLLNPIAVIVTILCNAAMVIEVYGFSSWFGLRINGVLVLNITIAVALTMEFTAHIGRAFVLTYVTEKDRKSSIALPFSNDGQIRMKKTLREMFTPVSLGALTTLIGVAPIAAAQFPYFRQYYFTLYVMIVLFGWLNGVIFQVVILSFIPPKPFIHNTPTPIQGGKERLQSSSARNPDSPTQPLVKHQELTTTTPGNGTTQGGPDTNEKEKEKVEIIQRKHTRTDKDAP